MALRTGIAAVAIGLLTATVAPGPAGATVPNTDRVVTYSPSTPTPTFAVTYNFGACKDLAVSLTLIASGVATPQTEGVHYSCKTPIWPLYGSISFFTPVTNTHTVTITRNTLKLQEISFKQQGSYNAALHELAHDRCMMALQDTQAIAGQSGQSAVDTHVGQADPHSQYALLAGRAGGQTINGGTLTGQNVALVPNAAANNGFVYLGFDSLLAWDDTNNRLGIGTAAPAATLDLIGSTRLIGGTLTLEANPAAGGIRVDTNTEVLSLSGSTAAPGVGTGGIVINGSAHAADNEAAFYTAFLDIIDVDTGSSIAAFRADGVGVDGLQVANTLLDNVDGKLRKTNDISVLELSGGILDPRNSSTPGIEIYGKTHGTDPGEIWISGDQIQFNSTAGTQRAHLDGVDLLLAAGIGLTLTSGPVAGATTITASDDVVGMRKAIDGFGVAYTVTTADCGGVLWSSTTGATVTLPDAAAGNKGCEVTIIMSAADNSTLNIAPHASDVIEGSCVGVAGAGAATLVELNTAGTPGKQLQLGATGNKGDSVTLISDGASAWWTPACTGEFATQP